MPTTIQKPEAEVEAGRQLHLLKAQLAPHFANSNSRLAFLEACRQRPDLLRAAMPQDHLRGDDAANSATSFVSISTALADLKRRLNALASEQYK